MTKPILSMIVAPSIPKELKSLFPIAYNLLWSWDHELSELFFRIDPDLWEQSNHNPIEMLGKIQQERPLHLILLRYQVRPTGQVRDGDQDNDHEAR